ncbi:transposase [Candidatus Omnitrophus magneticus]|uniref:Transposase n=1 Tax=Candidatus Omnitrophus magneticus TaxID=1609969 RepID=A0A0F0CSP3_9BACT|nr:transposase [Candidatus Omnitrophus magneticus]
MLRAEDSIFNKKFMDFSGFYGFKPILARPYKPNTKGKVENSVLFVRENFFNGEEFISLKDINSRVLVWLNEINMRTHSTTRQIPLEKLVSENLQSIENKNLYDTREIFYRQVYKDCYFSFNGNYYSVPFQYAEKEVAVEYLDEKNIAVKYRNEIITCHTLLEEEIKGRYITKEEHIAELKKIRHAHTLQRPKENFKKIVNPSAKTIEANSISTFDYKVLVTDLSKYTGMEV